MYSQNPNVYLDTTNTVINAYNEVSTELTFSGDTFYLARSTYYLNKYFNFNLNEDSLIILSDTILQRISNIEVIDIQSQSIYKTCTQVIKFNWNKSLPINEEFFEPFTTANKVSSGRWDDCVLYNWNTGSSGDCYSQIICDLPDWDTYNWCSGSKYTKIFEDNFEGNKLNETYWKCGYDWGREIDDDDMAWVLNRNIEVSNGTLKLKTQRESSPMTDDNTNLDGNGNPNQYSGKNFSSAVITSVFKYGYGKYEIKAKVPPSVGVNPAYWLNDGDLEIDGFEFFYMNRDDAPYMSVYSSKNNDVYSYACAGYSNTANSPPKKNRIFQKVGKKNVWQNSNFPNLADGNWYIFSVIYDQNYITWWVETENHQTAWSLTLWNVYQLGNANANPNLNCSCTGCKVVVNPGFPDNFNGDTKFILQNCPTTSKDWTNGQPNVTGPYPNTISQFEIDWVKIYVPDDCWNDVTENSGKFRAVDHGNKNYLTGNNITLGGNGAGDEYSIHFAYWDENDVENTSPNTHCAIRANNELILLDGFQVENDALFEGTISYHLGDNSSGVASDCNRPTQNDYYPQIYRTGVHSQIKDNILQNNSFIFPNPSNEYISITSQKLITKLEFYNSMGQLVLEESKSYDKIDISQLTNGIYFIKAFFENKVTTTKFVKQGK